MNTQNNEQVLKNYFEYFRASLKTPKEEFQDHLQTIFEIIRNPRSFFEANATDQDWVKPAKFLLVNSAVLTGGFFLITLLNSLFASFSIAILIQFGIFGSVGAGLVYGVKVVLGAVLFYLLCAALGGKGTPMQAFKAATYVSFVGVLTHLLTLMPGMSHHLTFLLWGVQIALLAPAAIAFFGVQKKLAFQSLGILALVYVSSLYISVRAIGTMSPAEMDALVRNISAGE